jgi:hypothetical protein
MWIVLIEASATSRGADSPSGREDARRLPFRRADTSRGGGAMNSIAPSFEGDKDRRVGAATGGTTLGIGGTAMGWTGHESGRERGGATAIGLVADPFGGTPCKALDKASRCTGTPAANSAAAASTAICRDECP